MIYDVKRTTKIDGMGPFKTSVKPEDCSFCKVLDSDNNNINNITYDIYIYLCYRKGFDIFELLLPEIWS